MSIPIGSPVTAEIPSKSISKGIVSSILIDDIWAYMVEDLQSGLPYPCFEREVKIRYDKPAPFTLWQLNAILDCDANQLWYSNSHPSHPNFYETAKAIEKSLDPNITSRMFLV